jgi:uncharacterized protein YajQ (UPF0234 family)
MPSFDVVSEVDKHELTNAIDQTNREVGNRFDFKGSNAKVEEEEAGMLLEAQSEFQIRQIQDILHQKLSKRGIDVASLEEKDLEERGGRARLHVVVRQGVDTENAKKIVKLVKESKIKVQAAIQGEQVRITGKKRDDLQQVMAMLRCAEIGLPLQFTNFRD